MIQNTTTHIDPTAIVNNTIIGNNVKIWKHAYVSDSECGDLSSVGDFSRILSSKLGEHTSINRDCKVEKSSLGRYSYTGKNTQIHYSTIGSFSNISWNVSIGGANHDYSRVATHSFLYSTYYGIIDDQYEHYDRFSQKCIVGNDVWIAANVCICRGVEVGNGAVIGAGSIVTKDIPPYAIAVGNPAKVIKMRFSESIIERLNNTRWWELPTDIIRENIILFDSSPSDEIIDKLEQLSHDYL